VVTGDGERRKEQKNIVGLGWTGPHSKYRTSRRPSLAQRAFFFFFSIPLLIYYSFHSYLAYFQDLHFVILLPFPW
jgi:hypothetical protein